ncbi:alpha/beta fold hydrolase [Rhizobium rhizophilum]|uniref:Alpha/beta hydrolase n=1 Tax=Rhizobium rhizophilum TaxID=1850373 RepID=A0ABY2QSF9_9HYPH|nr:alpha/beta hydrolase [Rhizobium rhizophilum]THV12686.1 alpha/beta hydrolase [Rhizobium rhizophilum]
MKQFVALVLYFLSLPLQAFAADSALSAKTEFADVEGLKLAYREVGSGDPLILFNRLRGTVDTWDPAFIDALAEDYRVILVDYPGVGYSNGELPPDMVVLSDIMANFAKAVQAPKFNLIGWSWGGALGQVFLVRHPEMINRAVLIGTNPAGTIEHQMRDDWFKLAVKPINDLKDEETLFFEPAYPESLAAARASHDRIYSRPGVADRIPSTMEEFKLYFAAAQKFHEDKEGVRKALTESNVPMLIICGDNDPGTPADNWLPLIRTLPRGQLLIMPRTGHGPQHQFPQLSAEYIDAFVKADL